MGKSLSEINIGPAAGVVRIAYRRSDPTPANDATPGLVAKNVLVRGHRTSIKLEPLLWDALSDIASKEKRSVNNIISEIDGLKSDAQSRTSAIRALILSYFYISSRGRPLPDSDAAAFWPHVLKKTFNAGTGKR
ncbi:MAG: ribbon-helix-helix domain-containing protein [Azospirillaceae bacterium]|nr:ribbon-helix-helix domain-containing protein [Azospirillaceae bacterium]